MYIGFLLFNRIHEQRVQSWQSQQSGTRKQHLRKNKPANKISQRRVASPNKQFFTSPHIGIREYV